MRVSSRRATATLAILLPRRRAMRLKSSRSWGSRSARDGGLDHHPAQPARTLLGDVAAAHRLGAGVPIRGQPGPRAEVVGRTETGDIPNLGHDGGGDGHPDARDRHQALDSGVLADERLQLLVGHVHLIRQLFDAQAGLHSLLRNRWQSKLGEQTVAGGSELIGHLDFYLVLAEDGVDLILELGPDPHQADPRLRPATMSEMPSAPSSSGGENGKLRKPGPVTSDARRGGRAGPPLLFC